MSWLRSYFLYFYFHMSKRSHEEKPFPPRGFAAMTLLVMTFLSYAFLGAINALFYQFVTDDLLHDGTGGRYSMSPIMLIAILIAALMSYLVCCYKIEFDEIEERLRHTKWLSTRSKLKLSSLMCLSFVITILMFNAFYPLNQT
ncbi:hypothetical protein HR060_19060 [Catenovulum sp. SM1970]|uniref:hypothetical protein n=1 Tax=Marinifaba aquimaris TaxID=2741323 RepID=UPI0015734A35|nr:hypothetical protein [Marinifaba aquimaris]NTS78934.1 hypothetical protein [Marinifaba aquimaris]